MIKKLIHDSYENYMRVWSKKNDATISILDIKKLAELRPYYDKYMGVYGIGRQLLNYMGYDEEYHLTCEYQHGANIQNTVLTQYETTTISNALITYGNFQKEAIERLSDKKAITIGPYISYVADYRTKEEYERDKRRFGKSLLVLYTHSIPNVEIEFDINQFIAEINKVKKNFDTVFVSVFFSDVNSDYCMRFAKEGYTLVSAGNNSSPYFMSRMRYILQLSDAVIANSFTSGIAYAMGMKLPIYIYRQESSFARSDRNNVRALKTNHDIQFQRLCKVCNSPRFDVLTRQQELGKELFGLDIVKTPEELKDMLHAYVRKTRC